MTVERDATQQLDSLREECIKCTQCELSRTRSNVVFGEGNPNSPLLIIGEGPGQHEDATGRPFVGRAGALLDKALAACRISRQHVFICNILKCRACIMENGRTRNRPPAPTETETCTAMAGKANCNNPAFRDSVPGSAIS